MPFSFRFPLGSAARRERSARSGRGWRLFSRSSAATVTPSVSSESSGQPAQEQTRSQMTTSPSSSSSSSSTPSSPQSLAHSAQEPTLNATSSQGVCDDDNGDRNGGSSRGEGSNVLEDGPPTPPAPSSPAPVPDVLRHLSGDALSDPAPEGPFAPAHSGAAGTEPHPNLMLPIIVIGLQSLIPGRESPNLRDSALDHHLQHDDQMRVTDEDGDILEFDGLNPPFGLPGPLNNHLASRPHTSQQDPSQGSSLEEQLSSQSNDELSRPRSWQNRAFSIFRGFRRTRRSETADSVSGDGLAPRTFLIYVINGFSPTDHPIIMGGNFDSFEALWELAEFLGQVKPPTASKEDIEKSGLEVIQASALGEYEKTGRVASNCTERCLVCLDDYAPDENLRVLTCKHVFHQACVDRWLETGRNNCPACRSKAKGVENTSDSSTTPNTSPEASTSTAI